MRLRKLLGLVVLLCACASEPEREDHSCAGPESSGGDTPAPARAPVADAPREAEVSDACTRALACCEAYVVVMGGEANEMSAATTCAGVRDVDRGAPDAEARCTASVNAWRQAVSVMNLEVPASCE